VLLWIFDVNAFAAKAVEQGAITNAVTTRIAQIRLTIVIVDPLFIRPRSSQHSYSVSDTTRVKRDQTHSTVLTSDIHNS
jgi:hypothetical protein